MDLGQQHNSSFLSKVRRSISDNTYPRSAVSKYDPDDVANGSPDHGQAGPLPKELRN